MNALTYRKPKLYIAIEGGIIQGVYCESNFEVKVLHLDKEYMDADTYDENVELLETIISDGYKLIY